MNTIDLHAPLQYLRTAGPAADPVTQLQWGLILISVVVFVCVSIALLIGLARRRGSQSEGELAVAADAGGLRWITVGVSLTVIVLAACALWTVLTLRATAQPAEAADLTVEVTAAQWWWDARYRDNQQPVFHAPNELHIPVGRPVRIELTSEDVIHSFWIPQLAGKIDAIPGRTNVLWLQADHAGTYRGQCAEFCGAQHAHMAMVVVADSPDEYASWRSRQIASAAEAQGATAAGETAFVAYCAACHTVRGTPAGGIVGPDLTHLMSRRSIAAGALPNTRGNLAAWIADPQGVKPGTRMPSARLSPQDLQSVVAWLGTLQ